MFFIILYKYEVKSTKTYMELHFIVFISKVNTISILIIGNGFMET